MAIFRYFGRTIKMKVAFGKTLRWDYFPGMLDAANSSSLI
jgi:hypothetical protein